MAPIIHCIRHGQGFHNLGAEYHNIVDPQLTDLGKQQCLEMVQKYFPDQSKISLVTASPMTRTLQTAFYAFEPALKNNNMSLPSSTKQNSQNTNSKNRCAAQILAIPDCQETSNYPCDIGSAPAELEKRIKEFSIPADLSLVHATPNWTDKSFKSRYSPASDAICTRARSARRLLRSLARDLVRLNPANPSPEIVLVAHGAFMHYFTDDWEESGKYFGTGWHNCEVRSYVFENEDDLDVQRFDQTTDLDAVDSTTSNSNSNSNRAQESDSEAYLTETHFSRELRGKKGNMYDHSRQRELYAASMQGWEDQGLQNPSRLGEDGEFEGYKNGLRIVESNHDQHADSEKTHENREKEADGDSEVETHLKKTRTESTGHDTAVQPHQVHRERERRASMGVRVSA